MSVEKDWDELRLGVKGQSNWEIAGSPRNIFKYSVLIDYLWGKSTNV